MLRKNHRGVTTYNLFEFTQTKIILEMYEENKRKFNIKFKYFYLLIFYVFKKLYYSSNSFIFKIKSLKYSKL